MLVNTIDILKERDNILKRLDEVIHSIRLIDRKLELDLYDDELIKKDEEYKKPKSVELLYSYYKEVRDELLALNNTLWIRKSEEMVGIKYKDGGFYTCRTLKKENKHD